MLARNELILYGLLIILLIALSPPAAPPLQAIVREANGVYYYIFQMLENCSIRIEIDFRVENHDPSIIYRSWIYLPINFENITTHIISGDLVNYSVVRTEYYFYQKYIFLFKTNASGGFRIHFAYNMRYGVLMVEPEAALVSPLIGFSEASKGEALVVLPGSVTLTQSNPPPLYTEREDNVLKLHYLVSGDTPRLYILFRVEKAPELVNVSRPPFTIITPRRYLNEARALLAVYRRVYPLLLNLTGVRLNNVVIRFFVPKQLSEFSVLGFVPFDARRCKIGEIHLNVFYLRAIKGILEYGAVHELIHHVLWKLHIMPRLLWVHEGLAEYLGLKLVELIDENSTYTDGLRWREHLLLTLVNSTGTHFSFLQRWRPGIAPVGNIMLCYAASYYIFRRICEEYGLSALRRLFYLVKELNFTISSNSLFVELLSKAVRRDLSPLFRGWSFSIVPLSSIMAILEASKRLLNEPNPLAWPARVCYHKAVKALEEGLYEYALYNARTAYFLLLLGRVIFLLAASNIAVALLIARRSWRTA